MNIAIVAHNLNDGPADLFINLKNLGSYLGAHSNSSNVIQVTNLMSDDNEKYDHYLTTEFLSDKIYLHLKNY